MTRERLLIIGGDAAGMGVAAHARRGRPEDELEIIALERGRYTSYSACGIPYWIGGEVGSRDELIARTPPEHRAQGIDVRLRTEATAIDLVARSVTARDLDDGSLCELSFDDLVIATGASPTWPDLPGLDASGLHGIQHLQDGDEVRAALDAGATRAVIVGAGYIGLEMAEALVRRGLSVTVIDRGQQPMSVVDEDMGALIAHAVRALGITLLTGTDLLEVTVADSRATGVICKALAGPPQRLDADLVILALGTTPQSELARAAGLDIGASGGIATDAAMRAQIGGVAQEHIWAAGDCVEVMHRVSQRPVAIALATHAAKQARVIGTRIAGGSATFPGVLGTAATKICALEIGRTGLSSREAAAAGFDVEATTVESTTKAGYFPGAEPITTKLLAERGTGRLLGAQIVGHEGSAKRIDVLATAIWCGLTVGQISELDLSYAPPFSPVWDPVQIAARKAAGR
jgi:NADPH-dependent 2,4-dienoyl-CoA reductase/sulfur reductase-like enzyme